MAKISGEKREEVWKSCKSLGFGKRQDVAAGGEFSLYFERFIGLKCLAKYVAILVVEPVDFIQKQLSLVIR